MYLKPFSMKALFGIVAGVGIMISLAACNKKKDNSDIISEETTTYAEEQLALEQVYMNADRVVERAFSMGSTGLGTCVRMWTETTSNPDIDKMTIDFGTANCLGWDGRYRSGRIIVEFTKNINMTTKGYYSKTSFEEYMLDGIKTGGTREIWNMGLNESGNMSLDIKSIDEVTLPGADEAVTGTSNRNREWFEGAGTPQTVDDKYRITGSGMFVGKNRVGYTVEIVRPLIDAIDCNWINHGTINIYPENQTQRVLDFGEGQCESDATINVNGVVRKVAIP